MLPIEISKNSKELQRGFAKINPIDPHQIDSEVKRQAALVNIKIDTTMANIDSEIKKQAQAVLNGLGIDMAAAIEIFLRQIVRNGAIPLEIADEIKKITT